MSNLESKNVGVAHDGGLFRQLKALDVPNDTREGLS